ncbi:DUF5681 domain-containing protein [Methylobacterium isbiliense]|jgi:hypothetical protein|uniref:DUF5681 domain-containing protein n=1 Tax=Methylobacterium isbiliense TaxID=315478 RepID=A0ABQ4SQW5_9HYPH|nr:DUF5681 domain-containing protein [Methylobacterium isbiliense]MDN3626088.1 DUF5681 domain-containing protein [Methylobacterium isbiliense]GJE04164.1 hypothetical protein GMJLKIPL_6125 [Methylobacterium isbiliense]
MTAKTARAGEPANEPRSEPDQSGSERRRGAGRPFQKGQSGNPAGRRPAVDPRVNFRELVLAEFTRMIPIREDGRQVKVPAIQAVVRSTIFSAVKGNSRSQHQALDLYTEISRDRENKRDRLLVSVQLNQLTFEQAAEKAAALGIPFPDREPDDVRQHRKANTRRTVTSLDRVRAEEEQQWEEYCNQHRAARKAAAEKAGAQPMSGEQKPGSDQAAAPQSAPKPVSSEESGSPGEDESSPESEDRSC